MQSGKCSNGHFTRCILKFPGLFCLKGGTSAFKMSIFKFKNFIPSLKYKYNNAVYHCNTDCGDFKRGIQNWKDFCQRINKPKVNYWILSFGLMVSCQKVPKFDFQSQFSMSKIIRYFSFFFIAEYQFRSTFFVIDIFNENQFSNLVYY